MKTKINIEWAYLAKNSGTQLGGDTFEKHSFYIRAHINDFRVPASQATLAHVP